jgi:hypothetical protein
MKKKWIDGAIKHPGAFTAQAKKRGMTADQFARAVTANPARYDDTTVKRANLAVTLEKMRP